MMNARQKYLADLTKSSQKLVDAVGYYEGFDDEDSSPLLCAIALCFDGLILYVVAQEDDSFELRREDWRPDLRWTVVSLMERRPWSAAKGKPLLWSWMLLNQQGYFDGLQLEFSRNSEDRSVVVQLVAIGSEVKQREVGSRCSAIAFNQ